MMRDKATEIANVRAQIVGSYDNAQYGLRIEIRNVEKIEGGVQMFVRAWKGTKQLGFGADGSVEWEHIRIFNPPILVPDGTKRTHTMYDGTQVQVDNFREDPAAATRLGLAHTISLVGKTDTNIIAGKEGRTVSTFYPAAGASSPADGAADENDTNATWTTIQGAAGDLARNSDAQDYYERIVSGSVSNGWDLIVRGIFMFDTSTIDDADSISAATLSLFGSLKDDTLGITPTLNIYSSAPASTADVVAGDYDSLGTTAFATGITQADFSISAYNDFALNASGIANISKTGVSKFGSRDATYDAANQAPTWGSSAGSYMAGYTADQAGTTNDPKLVVTHAVAVAAAAVIPTLLTLGVG